MRDEARIEPALRGALKAALATCRQALSDYQTGVLGDDDLRHVLFHSGLVLADGEAWLLDLATGRWWCYDGLELGPARAGLTGASVARYRHTIDDLAREMGRVGGDGPR